MNKNVTPKQLELTAGKTRAELLLATAPHIDPESPAFKADAAKLAVIEIAEAARAVVNADDDDFNWNGDEAIILKEQRATAVYRNRLGELVVRQQAAWDADEDSILFISPENETTFMEGLARRARES